jgi:hypothetical protein
MNLWETLEKNQYIGYGIGGILILVALVAIVGESVGSRGRPPGVSTRAYYTTEDQLTGQAALDALFVDDVNRVPPFDHNGKPAYLAIVYHCNGGRTRWVNSLKRWKDKVRPKIEALVADAVSKGATYKVDTADLEANGMEVKLPGPGEWTSYSDPKSAGMLACRVPENVPSDDVMFDVP